MRNIEKILQYLENKGIAPTKFEREVGIGNSYLKKTMDSVSDISKNMLERIEKNRAEDYYAIFPEKRKTAHQNKNNPEAGSQDWEKEYYALYGKLSERDNDIRLLRANLDDLQRLMKVAATFQRANMEILLSLYAEVSKGGHNKSHDILKKYKLEGSFQKMDS